MQTHEELKKEFEERFDVELLETVASDVAHPDDLFDWFFSKIQEAEKEAKRERAEEILKAILAFEANFDLCRTSTGKQYMKSEAETLRFIREYLHTKSLT